MSAPTQSTPAASGGGTKAPTPGGGAKAPKKLSLFQMIMMTVIAVGIGGSIQMSFYGLSAVTWTIIAAIFILLPSGLIAAELATSWPERGGYFRWVGEAFGTRWAFFVLFFMFLQIAFGYPGGLAANAISYMFVLPNYDEVMDWAKHPNTLYLIAFGFIWFWGITWLATRGITAIARFATYAGLFTLLAPWIVNNTILIIWMINNPDKIQTPLTWEAFIPQFTGIGSLVLVTTIMIGMAGLEMNAIHVKEMKNAKRTYPIAMIVAAAICIVTQGLGSMPIAIVIPKDEINLVYSGFAFQRVIGDFIGIPNWYEILIVIGIASGIANMMVWFGGPAVALLSVAKGGFLPRFFQKTNKHGSPSNLLYAQAAFVTITGTAVILLPSVQSFMQMFSQSTTAMYMIMYLFMFSAFLRLRYTQKHRPRPFKVPGGIAGGWIIGLLGLVGAAGTLAISLFPPDQFKTGSVWIYSGGIVLVIVVSTVVTLWIFARRKASWISDDAQIAPFTWQIQGLNKPSKTADATPTDELTTTWESTMANDPKSYLLLSQPKLQGKTHATSASAPPLAVPPSAIHPVGPPPEMGNGVHGAPMPVGHASAKGAGVLVGDLQHFAQREGRKIIHGVGAPPAPEVRVTAPAPAPSVAPAAAPATAPASTPVADAAPAAGPPVDGSPTAGTSRRSQGSAAEAAQRDLDAAKAFTAAAEAESAAAAAQDSATAAQESAAAAAARAADEAPSQAEPPQQEK